MSKLVSIPGYYGDAYTSMWDTVNAKTGIEAIDMMLADNVSDFETEDEAERNWLLYECAFRHLMNVVHHYDIYGLCNGLSLREVREKLEEIRAKEASGDE